MKTDVLPSPHDSLAVLRKGIIESVIADVRMTDTGNQALQHLAILLIIYEFATGEAPITTVRLGELTGVTTASLIRLTARLERLGVITRKRTKGRHGKGKAWSYAPGLTGDFSHSDLLELLAAVKLTSLHNAAES
ncbi:helix-turn-helix domain-containing protein [Microvirga lotononidis]|uniref:Uncharacterized protein n=1 Tax=Microvirga lotononidis TaxID=864069 RepID=I4Z4P8_9HYPH|nr:MarR family transcriptional regulator [Microvirga lotononidis]EIM31190.1 hypothetical protein MicloDRAFT_00001800 [Microvirga lotononidis]WQO30419.1 MarR family transcriptional regulator [Microvirga lotononidis]